MAPVCEGNHWRKSLLNWEIIANILHFDVIALNGNEIVVLIKTLCITISLKIVSKVGLLC